MWSHTVTPYEQSSCKAPPCGGSLAPRRPLAVRTGSGGGCRPHRPGPMNGNRNGPGVGTPPPRGFLGKIRKLRRAQKIAKNRRFSALLPGGGVAAYLILLGARFYFCLGKRGKSLGKFCHPAGLSQPENFPGNFVKNDPPEGGGPRVLRPAFSGPNFGGPAQAPGSFFRGLYSGEFRPLPGLKASKTEFRDFLGV